MEGVMEFMVGDDYGLEAVIAVVKERYRRQGKVKVVVVDME